MYKEIDSAELIIYQALKKKKRKSTFDIKLQEVVTIAYRLEQLDSSVRVNLGNKSVAHFVAICNNDVRREGDVIYIPNAKSPTLQQVFRQYGPSGYTMELLGKSAPKRIIKKSTNGKK